MKIRYRYKTKFKKNTVEAQFEYFLFVILVLLWFIQNKITRVSRLRCVNIIYSLHYTVNKIKM